MNGAMLVDLFFEGKAHKAFLESLVDRLAQKV